MVALPTLSGELAELIREQERDLAREGKPWPGGRATLETDLTARSGGRGLDGIPDERAVEPSAEVSRREWFARHRAGEKLVDGEKRPAYLLGLDAVWDERIARYDPARGPCPVCADEPHRREACLCCSRTADNPHPSPMQPRRPRGDGWDGSPFPDATPYLLGGLARLPEQTAEAARRPSRRGATTTPPKAQPRGEARPRAARRAEKRGGKVALRLLQPIGAHRPGETVRVRETIAVAYVRSGTAELAETAVEDQEIARTSRT